MPPLNMAAAISLNLSDPDDCKAEVQIAGILQGLVNGSASPAAAARDIDKIIVDGCQQEAPNPSGWQKYLWDCLGKSAMVVPSNHPGQDSLISLLEELQRLPRHEVPEQVGDEVFQKELWTLTPENKYEGLEQWLWELDQGTFTATRQVEDSQTSAISYANFSAFLARLLASEVAEATRLSALIRPSPFATGNPLTSAAYTDVSEAARHYEPWACAAAQWILHAVDVLYEMCDKETIVEIGKQKWTLALWNGWRSRFETVATTEQFSSAARELASAALKKMAEAEKKGVVTNVVDKFGFMSLKE
ncbi:MFS monocarboxylate transporter [Purpureocillium lavendulum]|uniref:MFS monocarboxylate transporter n=1 Tax=Purpureocillium lavendulum TaxID=1247861 RepID=A0AB34FLN6_9HYPO|nr:MFS monocarboxylate transporter [Purpureocillium lavendulum]